MRRSMYLFIILFNIGAFAFSQKITLNLNGVTLHEALRTVGDKANIDFFYSDDELDINRIVNVEFVDTDVEVIVTSLIGAGFRLEEQSNGLYLIVPVEEIQQGTLVSGVVTDEIGQPLPGVTVLVKETKKGVSTDFDGNYKIIVEKGQTLVFSYVGFKSQELVYENQKSITVKLSEDISALDEVVVTGIVERKKDTYTGAVNTVSGEELKAIGNVNVIESLKTLDPSFIVLENNLQGSNPNVLPNIEVRGKTSISNEDLRDEYGADPNSPLFILDGFETNLRTIVDLDMNRVASITILKDAASTALYGSKAANGVVVVETIKPREGQIQVSYTGDFTVEVPDLSDYNLMNSTEKLEYERLAGMWTYYIPDMQVQIRYDELYNERLADILRGVDTYWLSEPVRTAVSQRHSVTGSGGSEALRFNAGFNYRDGQGVMKGSGRDTWGGNVDLIYRNGKVNISNRLYVSGYQAEESNYGSFSNFANANPYYRKYNEFGEITRYLDNSLRGDLVNPLYQTLLNSSDQTNGFSIQNNFGAIIDLTSKLRLQGGLQVRKSLTEREVFVDPEDPRFDDNSFFEKGTYNNTETQAFSYMANAMLVYNNVFAEKHSLTVNFRTEIEEQNNEVYGTKAVGFPAGANPNPSFSFSYSPDSKPSYSTRKYRRNNVMGSLNYSYDKRYLVDFNYRLDGSTAFGSNEQFSPFWSAGFGWNIHNEKGFNSNTINLLRLKQTFGYTGNQNLGSVASTSVYAYGNTINILGVGTELVTFANANLEWQRTYDTNLGLDFGLFNNRLDGQFNLYRKNTDPLIVPVSLASSTGLVGYPLNVGRLEVRGFEALINYKVINNTQKDFMWRVGLTGATAKTEYDGFGNKLQDLDEDAIASGSLLRYRDGYSPDDIWAVPSMGIDPATGKEVFLKKNGQTTFDYDYQDEVVVGNSRPTFEGVFSNFVSLKGFTLGVNLRYRFGGQQFNNALFNKVENIGYWGVINNQDKRALYDRWQQPGDLAQFKDISDTDSVPISSRFVQDENVIIGESINFGYRATNKGWIEAIGMKSLRFNAYMNNIFRVSSVLAERGIDYPFARSVSFSINATF
ncbi:SusC/RagA family TonB-linked outer membrane protein [Aestuariibaculum lutulentum]|uniref:SusC/RagA family TonB-linked outer membrane protein n=1 Tax=Aestuariibaculum lutulentum TaxID=2920935 RepID=A0ABS9REF8_9FLAO|nr:SusC/RagA family TonB-linked outer membrane protein [Aestuariibaculum lutulentum]MCH4551338.1 SusC/RagA family TonB-linked outer membrane protein [Aestuariibaculum lutulentum]